MATPITELSPDLADRGERYINGTVSLIWPYSSSLKTFSLLLAEPDFRLRKSKGQVRAHFFGASAKALAESHVGIGDTVILSLQGSGLSQIVDDATTPGKCVDWDLQYQNKLHAEASFGDHVSFLLLTHDRSPNQGLKLFTSMSSPPNRRAIWLTIPLKHPLRKYTTTRAFLHPSAVPLT